MTERGAMPGTDMNLEARRTAAELDRTRQAISTALSGVTVDTEATFSIDARYDITPEAVDLLRRTAGGTDDGMRGGMRTVRVTTQPPYAPDGHFELDGQSIDRAITGAQIDMQAGDIPQVTLHLAVFTDVAVDAEVMIPEATRKLLVDLGWTPPEDSADAVAGS